MVRSTAVLGLAHEQRFAGKRVERVAITSADATKRRLRCRTDAGSDVVIDVPRGTYLEDGAVLIDEGERVVVVVREPEDALVIRLARTLDNAELVRQAVLIGHAFGNQHVPVDVVEGDVLVPITTSRAIAASTVERLKLPSVEYSFGVVALARSQPLVPQHSHQHGAADAERGP
jgi:urease accessory protein